MKRAYKDVELTNVRLGKAFFRTCWGTLPNFLLELYIHYLQELRGSFDYWTRGSYIDVHTIVSARMHHITNLRHVVQHAGRRIRGRILHLSSVGTVSVHKDGGAPFLRLQYVACCSCNLHQFRNALARLAQVSRLCRAMFDPSDLYQFKEDCITFTVQ